MTFNKKKFSFYRNYKPFFLYVICYIVNGRIKNNIITHILRIGGKIFGFIKLFIDDSKLITNQNVSDT